MPLRDEDEIVRAHDALEAVVLGELPLELTNGERALLTISLNVLCWVLHHDHNTAFEDALTCIHAEAAQMGMVLAPRRPKPMDDLDTYRLYTPEQIEEQRREMREVYEMLLRRAGVGPADPS